MRSKQGCRSFSLPLRPIGDDIGERDNGGPSQQRPSSNSSWYPMAIRIASIFGGLVVVLFVGRAVAEEVAFPDEGYITSGTTYDCDCAPPEGWFKCKLFGEDHACSVGILPSDHCFDDFV